MFENPPLVPDPSKKAQTAQLRAFGWAELVTRLAAAKDLRGVLLRPIPPKNASFADGAAGLAEKRVNYERGVNPIVLSDDKPDAALMTSSPNLAAKGDRELQND